MDEIKKTCCFTGHRPQKLAWGFNEKDPRCLNMIKETKIQIENAIVKGYNTFLCGLALGFDMICAEIILELKKKYTNVKLIGAVPCKNQSSVWNKKDVIRYNNILAKLDAVRCKYEVYTQGCMQERNNYMIENSSLLIALFNGKKGGTYNTLEYAKKRGLEIVIIPV